MMHVEKLAKLYIEQITGEEAIYQGSGSPDFITTSGRRFEIKSINARISTDKVAFKFNQLKYFGKETTIIVYDRVKEVPIMKFKIIFSEVFSQKSSKEAKRV